MTGLEKGQTSQAVVAPASWPKPLCTHARSLASSSAAHRSAVWSSASSSTSSLHRVTLRRTAALNRLLHEEALEQHTLGDDDAFIAVASDGVWEFLTNQTVLNMVASYKSPLKACKAVVNEAYKLWLQYDVRSDDITMIAIYHEELDGLAAAHEAERAALAEVVQKAALHPIDTMRARMQYSSDKRGSSRSLVWGDLREAELKIDGLFAKRAQQERLIAHLERFNALVLEENEELRRLLANGAVEA